MAENTVYVDISDLTEEEIDAVASAAVPLGADLEELSVAQNVEDLLPYAPIVVAVLKPFLDKAAEAAQPQVEIFLARVLNGRHPRTIHLIDLDVHLLWDGTTEKNRAAALGAIRELPEGVYPPGTTLVFDVATSRWQAP